MLRIDHGAITAKCTYLILFFKSHVYFLVHAFALEHTLTRALLFGSVRFRERGSKAPTGMLLVKRACVNRRCPLRHTPAVTRCRRSRDRYSRKTGAGTAATPPVKKSSSHFSRLPGARNRRHLAPDSSNASPEFNHAPIIIARTRRRGVGLLSFRRNFSFFLSWLS